MRFVNLLNTQEKAEVFDLLSDATQKLLSPDRLKEYADMPLILPECCP